MPLCDIVYEKVSKDEGVRWQAPAPSGRKLLNPQGEAGVNCEAQYGDRCVQDWLERCLICSSARSLANISLGVFCRAFSVLHVFLARQSWL